MMVLMALTLPTICLQKNS
jgi:hypothetical protein